MGAAVLKGQWNPCYKDGPTYSNVIERCAKLHTLEMRTHICLGYLEITTPLG